MQFLTQIGLLLLVIGIYLIRNGVVCQLAYGMVCARDAECNPYTSRVEYHVQCDKKSRLDATGICGCIGDSFRVPPPPGSPPPVNPNPILGYDERFNPLKPTEGCRRTSWIRAACNAGANSCETLGISIPGGEPAVVCRDVTTQGNTVQFKCVGRERKIRTFGHCYVPYVLSGVDCANLPNAVCVPQTNNFNLGACVPRIATPSGIPPVAQAADYICHDNTDCKDPNTRCTPYYPELVPSSGVSYPRSICMCDEAVGYRFSIVSNKEKCVLEPGLYEVCTSDVDCGASGTGIRCTSLSTTIYKICQCPVATPVEEYFEGARKDDASCQPVKEYGQGCDPLFYLDRQLFPVDNCRRRNRLGDNTGLLCSDDKAIPYCECSVASVWDMAAEKCVRKYVDLNEVCGTGSGLLPCNPLGNLDCLPVPATTTKQCGCSVNADKDPDGFAYCRLRQIVVGYGDVCDEITILCNDNLNLICHLGRCGCLKDEYILDTFTECQNTFGQSKLKSSATLIHLETKTLTFYWSAISIALCI